MNSNEIFALALGLNEPWEITRVDMTTTENVIKELHIYVGFKSGAIFHDKDDNICPIYDTKPKEWRHVNFFEHPCYLHCSVPRIKTKAGKV